MTGRHLLGDAVATAGADFFARVDVSGSHAISLARVASNEADVAAIDCVSYAHLTRVVPELVAATRRDARGRPQRRPRARHLSFAAVARVADKAYATGSNKSTTGSRAISGSHSKTAPAIFACASESTAFHRERFGTRTLEVVEGASNARPQPEAMFLSLREILSARAANVRNRRPRSP